MSGSDGRDACDRQEVGGRVRRKLGDHAARLAPDLVHELRQACRLAAAGNLKFDHGLSLP